MKMQWLTMILSLALPLSVQAQMPAVDKAKAAAAEHDKAAAEHEKAALQHEKAATERTKAAAAEGKAAVERNKAAAEHEKAADEKKVAEKAAEAPSAEHPIDINTASVDELKSIPGIGDVYSQKIVDARPYDNKHQLVSKKVIPEGVYKKMNKFVIAKQPSK